jgi:hypothetical protein
MKVLGIRFCSVSAGAEELAEFFEKGLGLSASEMGSIPEGSPFQGRVFPAGDSWIELWPEGPDMPECVMLQIIVDDADAWAEQARTNGLNPHGPTDAHGERIYYLQTPTGLPLSFQSKLEDGSP